MHLEVQGPDFAPNSKTRTNRVHGIPATLVAAHSLSLGVKWKIRCVSKRTRVSITIYDSQKHWTDVSDHREPKISKSWFVKVCLRTVFRVGGEGVEELA